MSETIVYPNTAFVLPNIVDLDPFTGTFKQSSHSTITQVEAVYICQKKLNLQFINTDFQSNGLTVQFQDTSGNPISLANMSKDIHDCLDTMYCIDVNNIQFSSLNLAITLVENAIGPSLVGISNQDNVSNILTESKRVLSLLLTDNKTTTLAGMISADTITGNANIYDPLTSEIKTDLGASEKIGSILFDMNRILDNNVKIDQYVLNYLELNNSTDVFSGNPLKSAAKQIIVLIQTNLNINSYLNSYDATTYAATFTAVSPDIMPVSDTINRVSLIEKKFLIAIVFELAWGKEVIQYGVNQNTGDPFKRYTYQ
jgi:hypothetical protein